MRFTPLPTFILLPILLMACQGKYEDQIYNPNPTKAYYKNSIEVLEEELADQSDNLELIELQLSYYKYLGWPQIDESALGRAEKYGAVSRSIRQYLLDYFQTSESFLELVEFIDNLERLGSVDKDEKLLRIQALIALGDFDKSLKYLEALDELTREEMHLELAEAYLNMENQALSMYHFYKAHLQGRKGKIMVTEYAPALISFGYYQIAEAVLLYNSEFTNEVSFARMNADILYAEGNRDSAEQILKRIGDEEAHLKLANWYTSSLRYDSAMLYYNKLLKRDSSRQDILVALGDLNQSRNYLTRAREYYQIAVQRSPNDKYIQEQLAIVNRKIAYLQKVREQQEKIPLIDIESIRGNK